MKKEIMDFVKFKVGQHMRISGIETTRENIELVMADKDLVKSFILEAIAAGI